MPLVDCHLTLPLSGQNSISISPPSGAGPARKTVRNRLGWSVAIQAISPVISPARTLTSLSLANASTEVAATWTLRSTFIDFPFRLGSADDRPAAPRGHFGDGLLERGGDLLVALADVIVVRGGLGAGPGEVHRRQHPDFDLGRKEHPGQGVGKPDPPWQPDLERLGLDAQPPGEPQDLAEPLAVAEEDAGLMAADVGDRDQRDSVLQSRTDESHAAGELDLVALPPGPEGLDVGAGIEQHGSAPAERLVGVLRGGLDRAADPEP